MKSGGLMKSLGSYTLNKLQKHSHLYTSVNFNFALEEFYSKIVFLTGIKKRYQKKRQTSQLEIPDTVENIQKWKIKRREPLVAFSLLMRITIKFVNLQIQKYKC
jgi:hypothetical protein